MMRENGEKEKLRQEIVLNFCQDIIRIQRLRLKLENEFYDHGIPYYGVGIPAFCMSFTLLIVCKSKDDGIYCT